MARPRGQFQPQQIAGDPNDRFGFPALIDDYCGHLSVQGYAVETIRVNRSHLNKLVQWLGTQGVTHPADVTRAMLEDYQGYLHEVRKSDGRPLSSTTQGACLGPVRRFYQWGYVHGRLPSDPSVAITIPPREQRLPRSVLSFAEAEAVLAQPDTRTRLGVRDRAILETLYSTGMRRSELMRLQIDDVDRSRGTVAIRQGKGRKDRIVPIWPRALDWIDLYLKLARPAMHPVDNTLFLSSEGGAGIGSHRLTGLVGHYVDQANIHKHGSCHMFRHTLATLMLDGGADIRYVQAMLGHASLNSTQIYTHVSMTALKAVHAATLDHNPAVGTPKINR